ncbi:MAG: CHAT domain-containing protein [bacterium]|nr:CHAT domain-containing protein [bacterium]
MESLVARICEEYEEISKRIESEKEKSFRRLLVERYADDGASEDSSKKDYEENIVMVALLSLRIKVGCEFVRLEHSDKLEQLKEDMEELVSNVQSLEYEWTISEQVRLDAYDLLSVICVPDDNGIIEQNYNWNLKAETDVGITPEMFFMFTDVANYMSSLGQCSQAVRLLETLCSLSRKRNNPDHKEVVYRVFNQIGYNNPESICKIGDCECKLFENEISIYSSDFYWLYGYALEEMERMNDALCAFEKCHQIRKNILGDTNYYTELALREISLCKFILSNGRDGENVLKRFIKLIESGVFNGIEDEEQLQIMEAKTLYMVLSNSHNRVETEEYISYLKLYEHLCYKYEYTGIPCLRMQIVWDMYGVYYLNHGDYMQAESSFLNALGVDVADENDSIISKINIQSKLLLVYFLQNDLDRAYNLALELIELAKDDYTYKNTIYRIYNIILAIEMQMLNVYNRGEIENIIDMLDGACEEILSGRNMAVSHEKRMFISGSIVYMIMKRNCSTAEKKRYSLVLKKIEDNKTQFDIDNVEMSSLYYNQAVIMWNIGDNNARYYFEKAIESLGNTKFQTMNKARVYQGYAEFLSKQGVFCEGYYYIEKSLNEVTKIWHSCVRYLNDTRLLNTLNSIQQIFNGCYAILRQNLDISTAYETLLQFKAVASLAIRERNKIIRKALFEPELLHDIQKVQNSLASLEVERMLFNTEKAYENLSEELLRLEKNFFTNFPQEIEFTEITLSAVKTAIPNDSAVLEYYLTLSNYDSLTLDEAFSEVKYMSFDVYITTKNDGQCNMHRITIPNGVAVMEDARSFVSIMQRLSLGEGIEEIDELNSIRTRLYETLILPVIPYIEGYGTLFIAPDNELVNLPFELLYIEDKDKLTDKHNFVKMECARDFLFASDNVTCGKGTLIISAPEYEVVEKHIGSESTAAENNEYKKMMNISRFNSLPFSKVEAYKVGKRVGGELYTGLNATKEKVLSAKGYENLHIATHGHFELDSEYASPYSSYLVFAGVKNRYQAGEINSKYGNGLLTADEVSRMDLSSTKLVVLSSCLSGMNDVVLDAGFYGMISAFSAAGTKYIISNLWSVADVASAVFMDAFYYYYANECKEPPIALNKAKNYLKDVTIDDLKKQGWFQSNIYEMLDLDGIQLMQELERKNGRFKPFRNEIFWGGFICYECY